MKRYLLILIFFIFSQVKADVTIKSCDGEYNARIVRQGTMLVERGNSIIASMKIDHDISGGSFSLDHSLLVVYGLPNKIDIRYPQTIHLSLYSINAQSHTVLMNEVYGGGVYGTSFSTDQHFISVDTQSGIDVLNLKTKTNKLYDPSHVLDFPTQHCSES